MLSHLGVSKSEHSHLNTLSPPPGLVKIMKKHDKQMLTNLRLPFISTVRRQPFTTTGLLKNLVTQCERTLQTILPPPPRDGVGAGDGGPAAVASEIGVTRRNLVRGWALLFTPSGLCLYGGGIHLYNMIIPIRDVSFGVY